MNDTTRDRLAQIAQRVERATEGPWVTDGSLLGTPARNRITPRGRVGQTWGLRWREDLEFIAHARTDIPAMHAALTAVLALHGSDGHTPDDCGEPDCWEGCMECTEPYPCPTVRAINDALGGE
jgi:hypothetical protein